MRPRSNAGVVTLLFREPTTKTFNVVRTNPGIVFTDQREPSRQVVSGVDLKIGYEYYDPNTNLKDGSFSRITIGAEFFPMSGLEIRPLYRINLEDLPTEQKLNNDEVQLMFHFYL